LLDLMLPKKDGFWVLAEVNKMKELSKIPILVLSNLGQETDKQRAISLGATDYLIKADLSIKEVIEKIKSYLIKK
jgi:DNA-binding response OmpR family regulator